jgi:hypothetical protein
LEAVLRIHEDCSVRTEVLDDNSLEVVHVTTPRCYTPNVQPKAERATDEPANQHDARGARSLFGRKLGIACTFLGSGIK